MYKEASDSVELKRGRLSGFSAIRSNVQRGTFAFTTRKNSKSSRARSTSHTLSVKSISGALRGATVTL